MSLLKSFLSYAISRLKAAGIMSFVGMLTFGASSVLAQSRDIPVDKGIGLSPSASQLAHDVAGFHDNLLMPIITLICLFVLVLLIWIVVRYNKRANKTPSKFAHNTPLEVIWTLVPVVILAVIGISSLRLLKEFNDIPKPDVVVKAIGNQWYWTYDYPDLGVSDLESRLLPEAADLKLAKAANVPYLLEVDNRLVVPVGKVVHIKVTATDVMHSFALPAFKIKADAVPGRLNDTWFKAEKEGVFYGQCSELCGKDHAYMPIAVEVVSQAKFEEFILKSGGSFPKPEPVNGSAAPLVAPVEAAQTDVSAVSDAAPQSAAASSVSQ